MSAQDLAYAHAGDWGFMGAALSTVRPDGLLVFEVELDFSFIQIVCDSVRILEIS